MATTEWHRSIFFPHFFCSINSKLMHILCILRTSKRRSVLENSFQKASFQLQNNEYSINNETIRFVQEKSSKLFSFTKSFVNSRGLNAKNQCFP